MIPGDWLKASKNEERKMSDYDVGYAKPPKHAQFKKGVCPNPHGRGKRRDLTVAEILNKVLNAKTDFRERGKLKKASRIELSIRRFAALATKGESRRPSPEAHGISGLPATSPPRAATSRTMSYFSILGSTNLPASAGSYSVIKAWRERSLAHRKQVLPVHVPD